MKRNHKTGCKEAIQKAEMKEKSIGRLGERAFIALEKAFKQRHCCICRLVRETEEQHTWFFLYEHTGDPPMRHRFDETFGFCHYHGQLAAGIVFEREMMSESATARLYETVVMTYREALEGLSRTKQGIKALGRKGNFPGVASTETCLVCEASRQAVTGYIGALLRILDEERHRTDYVHSDGLCNPHLALSVRKAEPDTKRFLLEDHERRMERLQKRLSELKRKYSYDANETPTPEERDSWVEALWRFTGVAWEELLIKRQEPGHRRRPG